MEKPNENAQPADDEDSCSNKLNYLSNQTKISKTTLTKLINEDGIDPDKLVQFIKRTSVISHKNIRFDILKKKIKEKNKK